MRFFFIAILVMVSSSLFAQTDTTYWNKGGAFGINFTQATLTNWSAGGSSSISAATNFKYFFDYKRKNVLWKNTLDMGIGVIKEEESKQRKADDRLVFTSSYGRKIKENDKWYYNATIDFRTQFAKGFSAEDVNQENYISKFMAPGYLMASMGVDWRPNEYFSITISPLTGKFTFVNDDRLAAAGAFGVDPGNKLRSEIGGKFIATFDKEIFKNGSLTSNLILFTNYTKNPNKVDVNWENTLTMKINDVLSANIYNQIIYDFDIKFEKFDTDGTLVSSEDKWQFKNIFGLGLALKFGGTRGKKG
ncbi:MAG: DUF3078 domain-containing protein [Reichenbachiella sp.]|uniref:DUF3078 domain-containing protein n=1 Tax=Reichenbachiella sp. TaxID=2184521 RepID=UPI0032675B66